MLKPFPGGKKKSGSVPVYLNVYDLTAINGYAYWLGLGVYHSGLQVHGVEYAYGAHEHSMTGIFESEPRQCPGFAFRKSILIGRTDLGPREVRSLIEQLAEKYTGNTYNLISKNCNHFCNDACVRLTNNSIPRWVNRLAKIGFLCNCMLPVQGAAVRCRAEESKVKADAEKRKLRSHSSRFATSNSIPKNSNSSPASALPSRSGRKTRRSASSLSSSTTVNL